MVGPSASEVDAPEAAGALGAGSRLVAGDLARVDARLLAICGAGDDALFVAARSVVEGGGKRLRPLLTLLSARAVGTTTDQTLALAVAVEVMHLASLMHDDVVDEAQVRRGRPAVREVWGNRMAVLVGDYLAARAYQELAGLVDGAYLEILTDVAMGMCQAETASAQARGGEMTADDCIAVAQGKTAGLFAACCELGALSAGASADSAAALRSYGEHFGIAFQITDDLLDIYGSEETIGKQPGRDVSTGQLTLPVVYALGAELGPTIQREVAAIREGSEAEGALQRLADLVDAAGGRASAIADVTAQIKLAEAALGEIPDGCPDVLDVLGQIAEHLVTRSY